MPDTPRIAGLSRRTVLGGLLAAPLATPPAFAPAGFAVAAEPQFPAPLRRLAALDYGLAETLIALGQPPIALVGAHDWHRWVVEPPLPPGVVNLGSSREPNLELLQQLRPEAILSTPYLAGIAHRLEQIAPVLTFPIYVPGGQPLALATQALERLATLTGREAAGAAALQEADATFAVVRARLQPERDRPLYLVSIMDSRHVRVYGAGSLFQDVLARIGLANAYRGPTNFWGFTTLGIEALEPDPRARLITFDPLPAGAMQALARNPLWTHLPFVKSGQVLNLPAVLMFGAVPSAVRFARLLDAALAPESGPPKGGSHG